MIPNLLNPVVVGFKRQNKAAQQKLDSFKETIGRPTWGATVSLEGQPVFFSEDRPNVQDEGIAMEVNGYIVVRVVDCTAASYTPIRGDQIVSIGSVSFTDRLFVTEVRSTAHYFDQSGPTLLLVMFQDREIP